MTATPQTARSPYPTRAFLGGKRRSGRLGDIRAQGLPAPGAAHLPCAAVDENEEVEQ